METGPRLAGLGVNLLVVGALFRYGPDLLRQLAHGVPVWLPRLQTWPYWLVALGLTVAVSTTLHLVLQSWMGPENLALGALLWWLLLAIAGAFWIPGGSFLGLWPLLFGLVGVLAVSRERKGSWRQHLWLAVTGLPTIILVAPLMHECYVGLGPRGVFVPMLSLVLALGALSLQAEAIARAWKWTLPVAGLLVALTAAASSFGK